MATPRRDDGDLDSQLDGERGDVAARSGGEVAGFARDGDAARWLGGETEAVLICEIIDSSCPRAGEFGRDVRLDGGGGGDDMLIAPGFRLRGDEADPDWELKLCLAGERTAGDDDDEDEATGGGELAHRELLVLRPTGIGCAFWSTSSGSGAMWDAPPPPCCAVRGK